jgi:hypothetical protein
MNVLAFSLIVCAASVLAGFLAVSARLADKYQPSLLVLGIHGGGWVEHKLILSILNAQFLLTG